MASLDHAMWFHHPFKMDDWLLYAQDSPSSSGARGFNRGALYTRDGKLVASVVQEGLMRPFLAFLFTHHYFKIFFMDLIIWMVI